MANASRDGLAVGRASLTNPNALTKPPPPAASRAICRSALSCYAGYCSKLCSRIGAARECIMRAGRTTCGHASLSGSRRRELPGAIASMHHSRAIRVPDQHVVHVCGYGGSAFGSLVSTGGQVAIEVPGAGHAAIGLLCPFAAGDAKAPRPARPKTAARRIRAASHPPGRSAISMLEQKQARAASGGERGFCRPHPHPVLLPMGGGTPERLAAEAFASLPAFAGEGGDSHTGRHKIRHPRSSPLAERALWKRSASCEGTLYRHSWRPKRPILIAGGRFSNLN